MAGVKKYVAKVGLDFDGLEGKPRVEAGQPIPSISDEEITELLALDQIEEVKKKSKEAE